MTIWLKITCAIGSGFLLVGLQAVEPSALGKIAAIQADAEGLRKRMLQLPDADLVRLLGGGEGGLMFDSTIPRLGAGLPSFTAVSPEIWNAVPCAASEKQVKELSMEIEEDLKLLIRIVGGDQAAIDRHIGAIRSSVVEKEPWEALLYWESMLRALLNKKLAQ
ncbi:hypothetical protein DRQ53_07815 [bacterium]|nr:MAG: hypothetical protein DRQ53_07815 [bacterium]